MTGHAVSHCGPDAFLHWFAGNLNENSTTLSSEQHLRQVSGTVEL